MNRYFGRTAAAGCLVGLASVCLAISGAHALDGRVSVAADMHIGPGANYPVVSSVPADVDVRINGCTNKDGWCAVRYDGRHGWVPSASVKLIGITRSTNKFDDAVIVIDVTRRRDRLPRRSSRTVAPGVGRDGAPVLRFDLDHFGNRYYDRGYDRNYDRYYSSSSDRYLKSRYGGYYDNRFGRYYDSPVVGHDGMPLRFDLERNYNRYYRDQRRYRSFIGPRGREQE